MPEKRRSRFFPAWRAAFQRILTIDADRAGRRLCGLNGCRPRPIRPQARAARRMEPVTEKKNQCIHCSVESCRHLKESQGICSLEAIQVAPTPMAYSGDPADESMCQSYETK